MPPRKRKAATTTAAPAAAAARPDDGGDGAVDGDEGGAQPAIKRARRGAKATPTPAAAADAAAAAEATAESGGGRRPRRAAAPVPRHVVDYTVDLAPLSASDRSRRTGKGKGKGKRSGAAAAADGDDNDDGSRAPTTVLEALTATLRDALPPELLALVGAFEYTPLDALGDEYAESATGMVGHVDAATARYYRYEAVLLLALIASSPHAFGVHIPVDAVTGSRAVKVSTAGFTVGRGKGAHRPAAHWQSMHAFLVRFGYLGAKATRFSTVYSATDRARALLASVGPLDAPGGVFDAIRDRIATEQTQPKT